MELENIKTLISAESIYKGTSLISLYIPSNCNMWLVKDHITSELKTADNIKNKNIGKAVAESLKMILHNLKMIKNIPDNGMVLCSGEYRYMSISTNQYV